MGKVEELEKYLLGLEESMPKEIFMIAEILRHNIFEFCEDGENAMIPYMMNDAVECYLYLERVVITGQQFDDEPITKAKITKRGSDYGLILYQQKGHVFTLWFQNIRKELHCYQYHEIGHFWRKGHEQWRQLVYIIGTIYEKYEYLGEKVCNPLEIDMLPLVEFEPFRNYSPIRESLEHQYPSTYEGIDCMENFALAASDYEYARMLRMYRKFPKKLMANILTRMLSNPKREALYHVIWDKVVQASESYPKRIYEKEVMDEIQRQRSIVDDELKKHGCEGTYPDYQNGNTFIHVTEEHPFTVLEAEDFSFQIQLMISECEDKKSELNSGFFRSKKRTGIILGKEDLQKN